MTGHILSPAMFFCGISGEAPQNPVVSVKSGHVYERRLIVKYIGENGTDPITGEALAESDLVSVNASESLCLSSKQRLSLRDEQKNLTKGC